MDNKTNLLVDPMLGKTEEGALDDIPIWPEQSAFLNLDDATIIGSEDSVRCLGIAICDETINPKTSFEIGDMANFYFEFEVLKDIDVPISGLVITNSKNVNVHGKNSLQYLAKAPTHVKAGSRIRFKQEVKLNLMPDQYKFQAGFATMSSQDYIYIKKMSAQQLYTKAKTIFRFTNLTFEITEKCNGIPIPFDGYADMPGEFMLTFGTSVD